MKRPNSLVTPALLCVFAVAVALCPFASHPQSLPPDPITSTQPETQTEILQLDALLRRVHDLNPQLVAAAQEIEKARAKHLSAQGAFDLLLTAKTSWAFLGYYDPLLLNITATQPTPWLGLQLYGGYRAGFGKIPTYDGKQDTLNGGELYAGFDLPLWRYRDIDPARAALTTTELDIARARATASIKRVATAWKARQSYWKWIATAYKLELAERMLILARTRAAATALQIAQGAAPDILQVDADRVVFERDSKRIEAEQSLREAALQLALFWRNPEPPFTPLPPARASIPHPPKPPFRPPSSTLNDLLSRALKQRPELLEMQSIRQQLLTQIELADNGASPKINAFTQISQDFGSDPDPTLLPTKEPLELYAGLSLEWPIQQREAQGKLAYLQAELAKLDADLQWTQDAISTEVLSTFSAIQAAYDQYTLAQQNADAAQRLLDAEIKSLSLGSSDLLKVYIREQAAIQARLSELDAWLHYQLASSALIAATADDAASP